MSESRDVGMSESRDVGISYVGLSESRDPGKLKGNDASHPTINQSFEGLRMYGYLSRVLAKIGINLKNDDLGFAVGAALTLISREAFLLPVMLNVKKIDK